MTDQKIIVPGVSKPNGKAASQSPWQQRWVYLTCDTSGKWVAVDRETGARGRGDTLQEALDDLYAAREPEDG